MFQPATLTRSEEVKHGEAEFAMSSECKPTKLLEFRGVLQSALFPSHRRITEQG